MTHMTSNAEGAWVGDGPSGRTRGSWALWYGLLGAPAGWAISELVAYMLLAHACYPNVDALARPNSRTAWPAALVVTACMLVVALGSLAVSWRQSADLMTDVRGYDHWAAASHRTTARRYLTFGGVLFSVVFAAFVVYNLIALLAEPACRVIA